MYIQSDYYKEDWYNMSIHCRELTNEILLVNIPIYDHVQEPFIAVFLNVFKNYNNNLCLLDNLANTKHCRISMIKPEYLNLEGEDLILSENQKKEFINVIQNGYNGNFFNVYLEDYYYEAHTNRKDDSQYLRTLPVPDYTKLPTT